MVIRDGAVGRAIFQPQPNTSQSDTRDDSRVHERNDSTSPNPDITLGQKMMSAVAGSILTSLLVTPLDVVRVRLQSQQPSSSSQNPMSTYTIRPATSSTLSRIPFSGLPPNLGVTACCREVFWVSNNAGYCLVETNAPTAVECAVEETERRTFTSTFDGMRKIARNEGFTTLWRGLSPTLMMAVPGNVIYFAGYDWLRTSSRSPLHQRISETYSPLIAGSSARVLAALFVSPIELFRTRMQASTATNAAENFRQTLSGVREMTDKWGYRSLWRGLTLTLWRDVPFSALYWWGYEAARNGLLTSRHGTTFSLSPITQETSHASTLIDSFLAGAISGAVASIVTTPFDVGKTRQQVYRQSASPANSGANTTAPTITFPKGTIGVMNPEDRSMPKFLWHILKTEGLSGLFKGWIPRTLKVAPACAIMISSYELGKRMALGANERKSTNEVAR